MSIAGVVMKCTAWQGLPQRLTLLSASACAQQSALSKRLNGVNMCQLKES